MTPIYLAIVAAYFACFASLFMTSWVRDFADYYDFVDRPDGRRKKQRHAVSLGGGVSIMLACAASLGLVLLLCYEVASDQLENSAGLVGLACGAALLCLVGLYDDLFHMRGVNKLIWQFVAAMLIVTLDAGMTISKVDIFGREIPIPYFGFMFSVFWILAAVNSLNLIDGMDGFAGTVGFIFSITIGTMALIEGFVFEAIIAFAMAGALMGFLRHNWPPAKIYMGDAGSMFLGVVLGTLSLRCHFKETTTLAAAGPMVIWVIPLLDSAAAVIRRKLTGRSMYATDRGHIHHRLITHGLTNKQSLYLVAALCTISSLGGVASLYHHSGWGLISLLAVLMVLIGMRIFGHSELMLLNNRIVGFGRMLLPGKDAQNSQFKLQGTAEWENIWEAIVESADRFRLTRIRLNLYVPQLHEDFYATWNRPSKQEFAQKWSAEIPLMAGDQNVGNLFVVGYHDQPMSSQILNDFAGFLEPLELQLADVIQTRREAIEALSAADAETGADAETASPKHGSKATKQGSSGDVEAPLTEAPLTEETVTPGSYRTVPTGD